MIYGTADDEFLPFYIAGKVWDKWTKNGIPDLC